MKRLLLLCAILLSACAPAAPATPDHAKDMGDTSMSMEDMAAALRGKTGDDFDRAFLEMMIPHHQGAIDMALLAKEHAGHREIKDMADAIIAAQRAEIDQMREWQREWGF